MRDDEVPLAGNATLGVVRVGDTVRRPVEPWTTSVEAVLEHLWAVGFTGAPRPLGRDKRGRQVVEFVPGEVGGVRHISADGAGVDRPDAGRELASRAPAADDGTGGHDGPADAALGGAAFWPGDPVRVRAARRRRGRRRLEGSADARRRRESAPAADVSGRV